MQTTIDLLTALAALLVAIGGVLTVVLVQGRRARAEADRMAAETQVMLAEVRANAQTAAHELQHNSGSSTKDAVARTEQLVAGIAEDVRQFRREMETERIARQTLDDSTRRTNSEIFRRLGDLENKTA
ncbi:hypothetical protein [Brooklawnia cerclae]|uniref:ABC-type transporter Mla subunit MlaD n=1 Tax=Brooklawnia cerclae TaxID=349934 RepID=A0ABX0SGA2_9ACTN|nr:hypothetical protein [Brooklawnia cerclae]NIH56235.1 ABC-type transporter Mla subunit MlaD [Brooklawnia cerclae]